MQPTDIIWKKSVLMAVIRADMLDLARLTSEEVCKQEMSDESIYSFVKDIVDRGGVIKMNEQAKRITLNFHERRTGFAPLHFASIAKERLEVLKYMLHCEDIEYEILTIPPKNNN
jgi:hypothetical protein